MDYYMSLTQKVPNNNSTFLDLLLAAMIIVNSTRSYGEPVTE